MERLQKVIAKSGIASRRKAEELIIEGKVKVNGEVITELGTKVKESDLIEVNDEIIGKEEKVYYLLNKPREVLSTTKDDKGRKTVVDLIDTDKRIFPVGRLDYDTTGAILLTNDGEFSNIITHPNNNISKEYIAKLNKVISKEDLIAIKKGVILDNKKIIPDKVKIKKVNKNGTCLVDIVIHEGLNHEVKRIFNRFNYDVIKLKRENISIFSVKNMSSGEYRKLTAKEVHIIYSMK
jgi:23S rRNA pseudouridine2605 synthase